MQKITAILLLLVLHAQPVANSIVFLDFLLNQEYIKEFLCINKEKPKLACNGKCFLMQQLQETQNEQEQEFPILLQTKLEFLLAHFQENQVDNIRNTLKRRTFICQENVYAFLFEKDIFHPPVV